MLQVSVIVPNYNHAKYLNLRIDSILNQTFQDFELIILDDYSTDNSCEVIEQYRNNPRVSYIVYNTENSGSTFKQWNKGIDLAQGEYIWIAESDDWAENSFLEVMVEAMQQDAFSSLVYSIPKYVEDDTLCAWQPVITGEIKKYEGRDFICKKLLYSNVIHNASTAIFRKKYYKNIVNRDYEKMRLCGDWLFYVLLTEQGNVIEVSKNLSYFRRHSNTAILLYGGKNAFFDYISIVDYISLNIKCINKFRYAYIWARQWEKDSRQYHFSPSINKEIKKLADKRQKLIYFLYLIFKLKYGKK